MEPCKKSDDPRFTLHSGLAVCESCGLISRSAGLREASDFATRHSPKAMRDIASYVLDMVYAL